MRPSETILVAVIGMSPAVLTETVWALAQERPPVVPHKVVVFSTTRGRDKIQADLLASGVWEQLRAALRAGPDQLIFGNVGEHIRVFSQRARELDDLRTPEDNAAAADTILEHLRQFTENPDLRIVASIAGGRKTMSALLYACMTLVGREDDRITHVLVEDRLEQRREPKFYFPQTPDEAAGIQLADIPFVPLRNKFTRLGRMPGRFSALVHQYARELKSETVPTVSFDDNHSIVAVNGVEVSLRRRALITLKFLVHLNHRGNVPHGINIAEDELKDFIRPLDPEWAGHVMVDDIRRELTEIRKACSAAGVAWQPGLRRNALRLPPFTIPHQRTARSRRTS